MIKDFKNFIMRGNVLDLAVAVIIGGAFGKIVSSLVADVIMPVVGLLLGKSELTSLKYVIEPAQGEVAELAINYGMFLQNIVDFLIIALVIFMMIKLLEKTKKKPAPKPVEAPEIPPADIVLLTEIRDLLKK